jgi:membrane protein YqaA with SNARE-associated domain
MFKRLYQWILQLSESRHAPFALAAVAFAESSFFPIPPDVILIPMSLAKPQRALRYAAIATIASVAGGALGYAIGALLYETVVVQWLANLYHATDRIEALRESFAHWAPLIILLKGLTPIPYKFVTIASGLAGYNFTMFLLLSIVTRGLRFFLVAGALNWFGDPLRVALERHFALFLGLIVIIIIAGFWIAARML